MQYLVFNGRNREKLRFMFHTLIAEGHGLTYHFAIIDVFNEIKCSVSFLSKFLPT